MKSYYDRPLLKGPHWGSNVVTYLFLGGIMGGLGLISLLSDDRPEPAMKKLRKATRYTAFALAAINPPILISHLGRPERFLNMLRIVKFKSPMSLGVWGLVLYSGAAGANALRELADDGVVPSALRYVAPSATVPIQALLGAFMAGYTGVLISATAIPLWAAGKRHIPAFSVCSGAASASALATLLSTLQGNHEVIPRLERLEMAASALEIVTIADFRKRGGRATAPLFEGRVGKRLRDYTILGGIVVPFVLNAVGGAVRLPKSVDALRSIAASTLTLIGGYVLRESLIEAGKLSANDPQVAFRQPS